MWKRVQKEKKRIECRIAGPFEKGICKTPSCKISKRECDEETNCIIRRYYKGKELMYVARPRNGFVPASRRQVFSKLKPFTIKKYPFVNLPETRKSRFGEPLDSEKMKKAVWVKPKLVAQIEFLEWTEADRLRHSKFVGMREEKTLERLSRKAR